MRIDLEFNDGDFTIQEHKSFDENRYLMKIQCNDENSRIDISFEELCEIESAIQALKSLHYQRQSRMIIPKGLSQCLE